MQLNIILYIRGHPSMTQIKKLYQSVLLEPTDALWFAIVNLLLLMAAQYIHVFHYNILYMIDNWHTGLWEWYLYESVLRDVVMYLSFAILPHLLVFFYLRYKILKTMKLSLKDMSQVDTKLWRKSALLMMVPGEIVRFIICLAQCDFVDKGADSLGQGFAPLFNVLFLENYLEVAGYPYRSGNLPYVFKDYLIYACCWLIAFAVYFIIRLVMYRWIWQDSRRKLIEKMNNTED